ncbi:hypothetical protein TL16_g04990 [Triparma laevis f. inornata]|uniref:SHOCT domain-containing protein n=1 Tax=Triparma laevis f. inornata TaxID=1714386 RepID=A0A9W7E886_9STRA|nr:hypothetical protein TL16_g04990 [Triparma laevis f. inornata]
MSRYAQAGDQSAEDLFFSEEPQFIKAYTFDRKAMINFETTLTKNYQLALLCHPIVLCSAIVCAPCCAYQRCLIDDNVRDKVNATHVALTTDGIKFVIDRHKTQCRSDCQDQGKISKTVAYSKITDADMQEPAGKSGPCCCMVENVLTKVNVDTASSGAITSADGSTSHELSIAGLTDPHQFKADVWAMIRGDGVDGFVPYNSRGSAPVKATAVMERGGGKSVLERMEELEKLKAKGYVTQTEFDAKRKEILADA